MAQINPGDGTIDPTVTDGSDLAARLERFYAAEASQNSGPSRPASLKAGGIWCKTGAPNSPELYMFDGTNDVLIVDNRGSSSTLDDVTGNGNTTTNDITTGSHDINIQAPGATGLTITPAAGQSADLLKAGTNFNVTKDGHLHVGGINSQIVITGPSNAKTYVSADADGFSLYKDNAGTGKDISLITSSGNIKLRTGGTNSSFDRVIVDSAGLVGINGTPGTGTGTIGGGTAKLQVNGDAYATGVWTPSDAQLKSNIQDETVDLAALANVKLKRYMQDGEEKVGVLAQDLEKALPNVVKTVNLVPDAWDAATDYTPGTKVLHGGNVYEALSDVATGVQPDNVWTPAVDGVEAVLDDDGNEVTPAVAGVPASGGWKPLGNLDSYLPQSTDGTPMREARSVSLDRMGAVNTALIGQMAATIAALEARLTALESK